MAQVLRGDGGGAGRREINSRGGASPEKSESGLPGVESSGIWVGRALRDMLNPPEAKGRWIGAWSDLGTARGGAGPWSSPGCGVQAALWLGCACNRVM